MARECIASINLSAIKKNYRYAKSLAPQSQVIAVVKANAYGHGAIEVAHQLKGDADCYGVACSEEAQELRNSGILSTPILLMEGIFEESEIELVSQLNLWLVSVIPFKCNGCLTISQTSNLIFLLKLTLVWDA